jgi:hypothetical protein
MLIKKFQCKNSNGWKHIHFTNLRLVYFNLGYYNHAVRGPPSAVRFLSVRILSTPCVKVSIIRRVYFAGHRSRVTGRGSQVAGHRSRVTGHGSQVAGHRSRVTGHRSRVTGHGSQVAGHRSRVTGRGSQVTGHRSQVTGHRSRVTGRGFMSYVNTS